MGRESIFAEKEELTKEDRLFEKFGEQLEAYTDTGVLPPLADRNVREGLQLQSDRLQKLDVELYYKVDKLRFSAERSSARKNWSDPSYCYENCGHVCQHRITAVKNGETLYDRWRRQMLYETITCAKDPEKEQKEDEPLQWIANYYFLEKPFNDPLNFDAEVKDYIVISSIVWGLIFFVLCLESGPFPAAVLWGILMGMVCSVPGGYLFFWLWKLAWQPVKIVRALMIRKNPPEKIFLSAMQEKNPEFSLEYFTGKALLMLRMILFSEDPGSLPFYRGKTVLLSGRLIEATYEGVIEFRSCKVTEEAISVIAEIDMKDLYQIAGKAWERRNRFRMEYSICSQSKLTYGVENGDWMVNSCIMIK